MRLQTCFNYKSRIVARLNERSPLVHYFGRGRDCHNATPTIKNSFRVKAWLDCEKQLTIKIYIFCSTIYKNKFDLSRNRSLVAINIWRNNENKMHSLFDASENISKKNFAKNIRKEGNWFDILTRHLMRRFCWNFF